MLLRRRKRSKVPPRVSRRSALRSSKDESVLARPLLGYSLLFGPSIVYEQPVRCFQSRHSACHKRLPTGNEDRSVYRASLTDRRANRMSRRVSRSLTPLRRAISISSRRRMASKPSSLSMPTGETWSLTADHVASKALSKISRSSGSNSVSYTHLTLPTNREV